MVRTACHPGLHAEACALTVATQIGVRPRPRQTFFDGRAVWGPGEPSRRPVIGSTMILGLAQIATDRLPLVPDVLRRNRDTGLLTWTVGVGDAIAALRGAHVAIAPLPPWSIACYDVAAIGAAAALARRRPILALGALALGTIVVVTPLTRRRRRSRSSRSTSAKATAS
jgi:hypothetical protein